MAAGKGPEYILRKPVLVDALLESFILFTLSHGVGAGTESGGI